MVDVNTDEESQWRFLFDLHGVVQVPDALSPEHVAELNAILDQHIAEDTDNEWRTLRFPVSKERPSAQTDNPETLLDWGKAYRDCLAVPGVVDICDAIIGPRFRLDHIYLDVIRPPLEGEEQQPGPIANGLHGSSGGFDPAQYFKYENGQMFNGLSVVGFNLCDIGPGDGGFACVPGTHKSNYRFPDEWRNMQQIMHETVRRCEGPAGSAVIFTEALTHGTLPWTGKGERRTLFMKISPHPLSWANGYFSTEGKEWEDELTDKQRVILEQPSVPGSPAGAAARQRMAEASAKL